MLGPAEGDDGPGEEVELHREPDPKPRSVLGRVPREQPVREEEAVRPVPDVGEPEDAGFRQRAEEGGAVLVGDAFASGAGRRRGRRRGCPGPILGVARRKPAVRRGKGTSRASSAFVVREGVRKPRVNKQLDPTFRGLFSGFFRVSTCFSSRVEFLRSRTLVWSRRPLSRSFRGATGDTWNIRDSTASALDRVPGVVLPNRSRQSPPALRRRRARGFFWARLLETTFHAPPAVAS